MFTYIGLEFRHLVRPKPTKKRILLAKRSKPFKKRLAAVATLNAAVGAALALSSAPANATTVYYTFTNHDSGTCLSGGVVQPSGAGSAFVATCNSSSLYQQWTWAGPYGVQLQNRASGLCLTTDKKTSVNAVWTAPCAGSTPPGQSWSYIGNGSYLAEGLGTYLRTDPKVGAIFTDAGPMIYPHPPFSTYQWTSNFVTG